MHAAIASIRRRDPLSGGFTGLPLLALLATSAALAQDSAEFDRRALSGHWDRNTIIESFGNVPGGARSGEGTTAEPIFTDYGRRLFDANRPGYGPRRQMQRNDPLGRCEPMGLPRHLNTEIVAPHATFEIVFLPDRVLQIFEYRHDWREVWMDGRRLPTLADSWPKWNGFSVGHWEGDSFVVNTLGFDGRSWLDKLGYPHSEQMQLEERYRLLSADTLELRMTVTDPLVYAEPFVSDRKLFTRNNEKSNGWDEQIYCIPAEEMSYQDLIGTGNRIE
jgi:hypothetical protein